MRRKAVLLTSVFVLLVAMTGIAMAADGQTIPHGGYDTSTNSCLYCHDVHEAAGDYVLMRQETVIETCGTCHDLYFDSEGYKDNVWDSESSGYPGDIPDLATASTLTAYNIDYDLKDDAGGHKLSQGDGDIEFADGEVADGNYIPGGSETLNALAGATNTDDGDDGLEDGLVVSTNRTATDGLYCASCHTPHGEYGQILKDSLDDIASEKLLSSQPNHGVYGEFSGEDDPVVDDWIQDGGDWCAKCHDKRLANEETLDAGIHNHPSDFCLQCHGNYEGETDTLGFPTQEEVDDNDEDFPHSSPVQNVLKQVPDELCITCHTEGSLP